MANGTMNTFDVYNGAFNCLKNYELSFLSLWCLAWVPVIVLQKLDCLSQHRFSCSAVVFLHIEMGSKSA